MYQRHTSLRVSQTFQRWPKTCQYWQTFMEIRNQQNWKKHRRYSYSCERKSVNHHPWLSEDEQISYRSLRSIITEDFSMRLCVLCWYWFQLISKTHASQLHKISFIRLETTRIFFKFCFHLWASNVKLFVKLGADSQFNFVMINVIITRYKPSFRALM